MMHHPIRQRQSGAHSSSRAKWNQLKISALKIYVVILVQESLRQEFIRIPPDFGISPTRPHIDENLSIFWYDVAIYFHITIGFVGYWKGAAGCSLKFSFTTACRYGRSGMSDSWTRCFPFSDMKLLISLLSLAIFWGLRISSVIAHSTVPELVSVPATSRSCVPLLLNIHTRNI